MSLEAKFGPISVKCLLKASEISTGSVIVPFSVLIETETETERRTDRGIERQRQTERQRVLSNFVIF